MIRCFPLIRVSAVSLLFTGMIAVGAEEPATPPVVPTTTEPEKQKENDPLSPFLVPLQMLQGVVDSFPDFVERNLPGLDPKGAYRIYVRPHFGDFLHRDYVRIPVGVKTKVAEKVELNAEVEVYITHGLDGTDNGNGFSMARFGTKYETTLGAEQNLGVSAGFNYFSPLSRPPRELTDGMRHLQPYVGFSKPIYPRWGLIGFGTFGVELLSHSPIPPNFGGNQLHTNSMGVALGAAKGWKYFYSSLTVTAVSGMLLSDEGRQVYSVQPELTIPLKMVSGPRANILLKLTGHATTGPDGQDYGIGSSVRVELKLRHKSSK
jgi:hypothetical protein